MQMFEIGVGEELLARIIKHGIRVNAVATEALWIAVDAAEGAQALGEGVEPAEDEEAAQMAANAPYAVTRTWYTAPSYYELMNEIRRINRRAFGRRARLTIIQDGNIVVGRDGVGGNFIVEVRRSQRKGAY